MNAIRLITVGYDYERLHEKMEELEGLLCSKKKKIKK